MAQSFATLAAATVMAAACGLFARSANTIQTATIIWETPSGTAINGQLASRCFADTLPPTFTSAQFVSVPAGATLTLAISGPLPPSMLLNLYPYINGIAEQSAASTAPRPAAQVTWSPAVVPGNYILGVYVQDQPVKGACAEFWYPVTFTP